MVFYKDNLCFYTSWAFYDGILMQEQNQTLLSDGEFGINAYSLGSCIW